MKKSYVIAVLALASLLGFGTSAIAQDRGEVSLTVPYEFVAGGKILPAGKYIVSRVSDQRLGGLSIRSSADGSSVFVMASQFQGHRIDNLAAGFEEIDGVHFLTSISASDGVYTIPLGHTATVLAKAKQRDVMSASGTN